MFTKFYKIIEKKLKLCYYIINIDLRLRVVKYLNFKRAVVWCKTVMEIFELAYEMLMPMITL